MAVAATCILAVVLFIFKRRRTRRHKNRKNMDETETERLYKDEEDRNVSNGVEVLSRTDGKSLFVHGKFGNSVSSTSHLILEKFIENNVEWKSLECLYTDIPENVEENTIMFVYGWFGIWNDDLCSVDKVKKACKELHDILCKETNVRIVIGMRTEYHRKYHTHGCFTPSDLFSNELSLDAVNNEKDKEHIKYFMKKIKKPCKKSECYCHDLKFDNFRDDRDKRIGIPLKMNVLARYHDIINDYVVKRSLLKAMTNHITTLRRDEKTVVIYQWIMYICLKGQYKRSEELDEELIKTMEFEISGLSFNENEENLMKYLKFRNSDKQKMVLPESAQYVFWHPFIYICAFHSLFTTNPDIAMNYCNIDAILQLVRPENYLDTYLEVHADDAMIDLFNQRIQSEGLQDVCKDHPLIIPSADKGENIEDVEQSSEGTPSEHGSFTIISQKAVDMMNM
ncbi:uncharacterized protein LOC134245235 [Saccostrea cucullata]|uniref:uncharacterized protein LOC134245235 n=1 Tax=Saccostrea cuccullata TaxID=36930 RepID=UPI002ED3F100